jgi:hypothetical protein
MEGGAVVIDHRATHLHGRPARPVGETSPHLHLDDRPTSLPHREKTPNRTRSTGGKRDARVDRRYKRQHGSDYGRQK